MDGDCTPALAMVTVQMGLAGLNVVSKLALNSGMSPFVLIAYRQMIATLVLAPAAFFFERKTCMKISGRLVFQIFLCSLFGATANQLLYFLGLQHTTPTIACALSNTLPAITFIMAIPFRMETVDIKTLAGQAKVMGTTLCVGGSMVMTFYQGPPVKLWPSIIHWKYVEDMSAKSGPAGDNNIVLGATLVIASSAAWSIWFIMQTKMSKSFSSPYTTSAIMCFLASVECVAIGAGVERDLSRWAVGWGIGLAAVLYIGLVGSGLTVSIMSWCLQKRGPLFVSMFSPLLLVIVAVLGWAILDEKLHLGSVTGSVLIVGGLYLVLWGKGRELKKVADVGGKTIDEELGVGVVEGRNASSIGLPVISTPGNESQPDIERGV